ncbi:MULTISPECIES: site-2 protease family protein [unclassified Mycolicibacterium]|uniref:site-2 protease family protein n=1 Tax=unclassified Mycolicibacterium TaxID=2636767 RepID=UPI00130C1AE2|nr:MULTISPECIES: site-2 protease family protein [unclassified Mycolicibacterium]MUL81968.1 site-2 protease family protein [Mycolicibacterium sp. CBMA 329]MUL87734.1 site-2 protease family protein [Mycolicibacterium sp. CBMA 331]MUL99403.1 site-2 protease family protein [Mycolicibacterium sp. CBMA 334]MUM29344.1 site-2 protease family protein [Mycolicibacterium sp. CBMA 295]MUM38031.1 site-2 protease family protein [Mycolicibacterium sp. CBMA 247]
MNIRPLHQSVRPSPVFLAVVALTVAGGVLAWLAGMERTPLSYVGVFILVIAGWLVSLCLHEFGHAFTAWRFGDHDVAVRGYLTLNPFKYSHPLLSLGLPVLFIALGGIGLPGGAVYVRTSWMTARQKTLVSLAGPAANLVLAVLLLSITRIFFEPAHAVFWSGLAFLGFLQVTAVLLNLLPIPGLDGYGALEPHLSADTQRALEPAKQWGFFILMILLITPTLNRWFFSVVFWFVDLSGVSSNWVSIGSKLTRFWSAWL